MENYYGVLVSVCVGGGSCDQCSGYSGVLMVAETTAEDSSVIDFSVVDHVIGVQGMA